MRYGFIRYAVAIFLFLPLACPAAFPEEVYETGYVCRLPEGRERWEAVTEIRKKEGHTYVMTERGAGEYHGFEGAVSWVSELEFEMNEARVKPLKLKKQTRNAEGDIVEIDTQRFNYRDNTVTCTREDVPEKKTIRKKFKFQKNIVNRMLLGLYIRNFIKSGERQKEFRMVSSEPRAYNVNIRKVEEEEIEVNGRKRAAYRICLDPDLGLMSFVKVFLPKAYVWHSAEPDHEWLRYKGLESGVSSPQVVITTLEK
ncbi:MAG: hypothetical protein GF408_02980 [Candidatus Omnitrophica bacterium]|nr:hypothetical protein [Candidatus Omnitrophota bacterium]